MKNKFQFAMTLAVILAMVLTSLALADTVQPDNDFVAVGNQASFDLGNTTPGATLTPQVSFTLVCAGNQHVDNPQSVSVAFTTSGSSFPAGGSLSASTATIGATSGGDLGIPAVWPDDGSNCASAGSPSPLSDNGNSTVTIGAPNVAGSYTYTVKYNATPTPAGSGDTSSISGSVSVTFTFTVVANTAPSVSVTGVANGSSYEFGSVPAAGCSVIDAEDGNSTPVATLSAITGPLSAYGLGSRTASCSYTDGGGLSANASATYSIVDTTKPTIDAHGDETAQATGPGGANVSYTSPATHDAVFGNGVASCAPASGTLFAIGNTTVTCNATDGAGNAAVATTFVVHVVDTTAPVIAPHGDETAEATSAAGAVVSYTSPTTSDAVDGAGTASCSPLSGSIFALGNTTVTCNKTDAHGNVATPTAFVVHVVDTTSPTFSCGSADSIWHAGNQTVACTASDSGSGLATSANFSLNTNVTVGNETAAAFTNSLPVCDLAGNCVTADPVGPFKIDRKAPSVSATPDRSADFGDWYNHALTITFSGTDGGSDDVTCAAPVNYSGPDDDTASVSGSCSDAVGNSASASFDFKYDDTAPTAALSVTAGTEGANGWYTSDMTVHTSGIGSVSGMTCTADQFQNTETTGFEFNGSCTSGAGLTTNAAPLTIKLDKTGPTAVLLTPSGTLGLNGWYISDVTITTSGTDTISAPVTCTTLQSRTTDTTGATFNGSCSNDAGLTINAASLTIKRDATAPTISASISPAVSSTGWWNIVTGAPTVTYTCSDATSLITSCTVPNTFLEDVDQVHTGTAVDNAGNTASTGVTDIDVDLTVPSLTWDPGVYADGASFYFGFVPAWPPNPCITNDVLSGPHPDGCAMTGYATTVGTHTLTATGYDVAGNSKVETRTYTVMAWTLKGFYQPVDMPTLTTLVYNTVKNGSTVPLKFEIFAGATELTNVSAVDSLTFAQTNCSATAITDDIETMATGGTVLRYDSSGGQFIFNWKTPNTAGKCYRVTMTAIDGSSLVAYFKLK